MVSVHCDYSLAITCDTAVFVAKADEASPAVVAFVLTYLGTIPFTLQHLKDN